MPKLKEKLEKRPKYWVDQIVSFPIYSFNLDGEIDPTEITKCALNLKTTSSNREDIVINGYQSAYYTKSDNQSFEKLISCVEDKVNLLNVGNFSVDHYWFVLYNKTTRHYWHKHLPFEWSAAYYPEGTHDSPIVFQNANGKDLEINQNKNSLLLFSSQLSHSVPKCNNDENRIVFSFNLSRNIT